MNKSENTHLLVNLLNKQVSNYKHALELEKTLGEALEKNDLEKVGKNTRSKSTLMAEIQPLADQISAAFECEVDESSSDLKNLRIDAKELLKEIDELQTKNMELLNSNRENMLSGLRETKVAKQVAKGYKQGTQIYRNRLDTKS